MDPEANLERQRELAQSILAMEGKLEIRETGKPTRAVWNYADELAELVLALDEWRRKGGFDPLANAPLDHIRALVEYNWSDEQRDFEEEDERSEGPAYAEDGTRVWHVFERMRIIDEWLPEVTQGSAKPKVVTLVIRDPDYENEYVEEVTGEVEVETISLDLGSQFNGVRDFDAHADWGREWIEEARESVAHLPEDGPIRQRVEELINHLTERTQ